MFTRKLCGPLLGHFLEVEANDHDLLCEKRVSCTFFNIYFLVNNKLFQVSKRWQQIFWGKYQEILAHIHYKKLRIVILYVF